MSIVNSGRLIVVGRLIELQDKLDRNDSKHDFIDSVQQNASKMWTYVKINPKFFVTKHQVHFQPIQYFFGMTTYRKNAKHRWQVSQAFLRQQLVC